MSYLPQKICCRDAAINANITVAACPISRADSLAFNHFNHNVASVFPPRYKQALQLP